MSSETRLKNQPKYKIGQAVDVLVETTHHSTGKIFSNKITGLISVIEASGTSKSDTYRYGITTDMPGCYHGGKEPFIYIEEDYIKLVKEEES